MQYLEILFTPCNYLHKEYSDVDLEVPENCISDKEEQFEYLT